MSDSKKKIYLGSDLVCQTFTDAEEQAKAFDLFGLEQPIVSSNAPASTRPVQQGQVCEFDGVNDRIENLTDPLGDDCTISTWVKVDAIGVLQYVYDLRVGNSDTAGYLYVDTSGNLVSENGNEGAISAGVWTKTSVIHADSATSARMKIGARHNNASPIGGKLSSFIATKTSTGEIVRQYNLNHASGTTAFDSSGNGNDGTLQNGAAFVVDNTLPPEADRLNLEGFSKATVLSASSSRVRFNTGVIPTFEASKIRVGWYQPYEITSATSGKTLCALYTTNGAMSIKIGNSTGLATNETLTFSGNTSSRTYLKDVIPAGYHVVEIVSTGSTTWDIYLDDALMTKYTYSASTEKTVNQVWVGPSLAGSDGVVGAVFQEFKIWDDSDVLQVDIDMENSANTNLVGGESPNTDTGSVVIIPRDESDSENDIFGNPLQYSGSVYPRRPEYRNSYAASFDGVNDYVDLGTPSDLDFDSTDSFSVYTTTSTTSSSTSAIIAKQESATNFNGYMIVLETSGKFSVSLRKNLSNHIRVETTSATIDDGDFHEIGFSYDGSQSASGITLYVDSVAVAMTTVSDTLTGDWLTSTETRIGSRDSNVIPYAGKVSSAAFYASEVAPTTLISPVAHYPLTEGAGDTAHDISGNDNHSTINNASTGTEGAGFWAGRIDGEANALNNNNGFSKRMLFDGVNDYVSFNLGSFNTSAWSVKATFQFNSLSATQDIFSQAAGTGTGRAWVRIGTGGAAQTFLGGLGSTTIAPAGTFVEGGVYEIELVYTLSPNTLTLIVNGVSQSPVLRTVEESTGLFHIGVGHIASGGWFSGTSYNATLNGRTYAGDGNTNANWEDTSGNGNNGTVNGSPALLRIPADTSDPTKDVLGYTLTNPAITDGYNGAETELDAYNIAEGENPSPATNNNPDLDAIEFGTDFASNDAAFMRLKSSTENDRLITFADDLTGGDETLAQKYTQ